MSPDLAAAVGAGLLLLAALAGILARAAGHDGHGRRRPWSAAILPARLGSVAALIVALYLSAQEQGHWSAQDLRQVTLGLATATAALHAVLALLPGLGGGSGSPVVDLLAAALAIGAVVIPAGGPALSCFQRSLPYQVEWALLILGGGGLLVAGGAALHLALGRQSTAPPGIDRLLSHGTYCGSLLLGGGILVGVWWAWQGTGTLLASDVRESWMAATWLLAAMGLGAWQLERQALRWAAWLALAAAAAALFGLLALPDVYLFLSQGG